MKNLLSLIFKGSWLTRLLGIAIILHAISGAAIALTDNNALTQVDWDGLLFNIGAGWGIAIARQNNVSSQDVGIRPPVNPTVTHTNMVNQAEFQPK